MLIKQIIHITEQSSFKNKLLFYGNKFEKFMFLDSSDYIKKKTQHSYYEYDFICALGSKSNLKVSQNSNFENLKKFNKNKDWMFGYLTYDLKNETEDLKSENTDKLNFPKISFFIPNFTIVSKDSKISLIYNNESHSKKDVEILLNEIYNVDTSLLDINSKTISLNQRFSKDEYIETVKKLKNHIQIGDIYEINFCQEFYSNTAIDSLKTYNKLRKISPTPFSCYFKNKHNYLLSASPERFLKKNGNKIISQPIKGTIRRGKDETEDKTLKEKLFNDPKERAENVMIVDLVRNDLSRTAKKGSVKVEELFGVYSFTQVHQLISTVVSEIEPETDIIDVIKNAFPMGSMTGAPKVKAMQLIEQYEKTKRGLYSGAVGFITPEKDFDFNVVIRSILYNELKKYVSFTVGGAITSMAKAEEEYDECMIKAKAMIDVLK
jgi:para-aminobenzoate synthetase component 1